MNDETENNDEAANMSETENQDAVSESDSNALLGDFIRPKRDDRPRKDGWSPGWYLTLKCMDCNEPFIGDKRAVVCAPCAYKEGT